MPTRVFVSITVFVLFVAVTAFALAAQPQTVFAANENYSAETDWTGVWETTIGTLVFRQDAQTVIGVYSGDSSRILGKIDGKTLKGMFVNPAGKTSGDSIQPVAGEFRITISEDGLSFSGTLNRNVDGRPVTLDWSGKLGSREISPPLKATATHAGA